jgi:streptogramin lyase/cytochrome c551/c552
MASFWRITGLLAAALAGSSGAYAAAISGRVLDLNGQAVANAMVTVAGSVPGPVTLTVFSDAEGKFHFPDRNSAIDTHNLKLTLRALGHELIDSRVTDAANGNLQMIVLARPTTSQVNSAPPSAWLGAVGNHESNSSFILDCIGCHQVPAPQFRDYANAMADVPGEARADITHRGWTAIVNYMNFVSAEEFGRGPEAVPPDAKNVYSVGNGPRVIDYLTANFPGRMNALSGYKWGAPLATTARTVITEYELPRPNAVREAVLLGNDRKLYVADVSSNRIFKVDPDTGESTALEIPWSGPVGPHSLHRGADGSLWIAPFVSSAVARLDVEKETWTTWPMKDIKGTRTGIHDLSFSTDHTVLADRKGRVWFSDIGNNSVGYLDPKNGRSEIYRAPPIEGRPANGSLYGLAMSPDRKHLWYSQLAIGRFGSFNIETRKFEDSVVLPMNAGPRRLAINDQGILYVPLYGSGQLVEYDTRAHRQIGVYDLPDLASAPYAVTWDPVRKVVWIPTSNADAIYRFNPSDKSLAVLPMPRTGAMLRMVDVDPETGHLITSYANIVEQVHGPRMALIIDPGDDAYANVKSRRTASTRASAATVPVRVATAAVSAAGAADGASLVRTNRCYGCHHMTEPLLGPPYKTIAARYGTNRELMTEVLARKIVLGGGGNWGVVPMVPNEQVSATDAHAIAAWILNQAP